MSDATKDVVEPIDVGAGVMRGDEGRRAVLLSQSNGHLTFEVADDGSGFDPGATGYGTGLQGIADRVGALHGDLVVSSRPGDGTRVVGRIDVVPMAATAPSEGTRP